MKVTLIAAQSVDGYITRHDEPGSAFTSSADKENFSKILRHFDCRVMGATTYRSSRDSVRRMAAPERLHKIITRDSEKFAADAVSGALEFTSLGAREILKELVDRGRKKCALLGGSQVHSLFLEAGCVDELWLTIEPKLFGRGTPLVAREIDVQMKLLAVENLSADTLLLKYKVGVASSE